MINDLAFSPISVSPKTLTYELLLTAATGISHHDPAVQDDSNRTLFNRQKQILPGSQLNTVIEQHSIDALSATYPVPADIRDVFSDVSFIEFVSVTLCRLFIDFYNSQDGTGLFSGMERYSRLEARLKMAAIVAPTLRAWWNRLCDQMQVPIHGGDDDAALFMLLSLPANIQQMALRTLSREYRAVVALARLWHSAAKLGDARYAQAVGKPQSTEVVQLHWNAEALRGEKQEARVVEIPVVSGNSLRHQVVREPAWLHLCQHLGLEEARPGQGPVPPGVEAIFYNGGNIAAGAKQPSNVFSLAAKARSLYPSLDLLGGVTDSFDLGESRLKVAGWLVCLENREALQGSPAYDLPAASISAFEMLDDVTLTRQAGMVGLGQMIFSFETLCSGTQIVCRLNLAPYTPSLTHGALLAAVETYLANMATIGGQAARGFGHCAGQWLSMPGNNAGLRLEYEAYLAKHKDELRVGLCDGTLGTGVKVLS